MLNNSSDDDDDEFENALKQNNIKKEKFKVHHVNNAMEVKDDIDPDCGILYGCVVSAEGLPFAGEFFVRVSYVEPGCDNNVMFRSKKIIFETVTSNEASLSPRFNESFQYEVFPPEESWNNLAGDILFALYTGNGANIFVGQSLVPLKDLLDDGCSRENASQTSWLKRSCELKDRNDKKISTTPAHVALLKLEFRLEIPEAACEKLRKEKENKNQERASGKPKIRKAASTVKSASGGTRKPSSRTKSGALSSRGVKGSVKPGVKKPSGTTSKRTTKTTRATTTTTKPKVRVKEGNKLDSLADEIDSLQKDISTYTSRISVLKAGIARETSMAKRNAERKSSVPQTSSGMTSARRSAPLSARSARSTPELESKKRVLIGLIENHAKLTRDFEELDMQHSELQSEHEQIRAQVKQIQDAIADANERQKRHVDRETKQEESAATRDSEERNLRIEIRVLRQEIEDFTDLDLNILEDQVKQLEAKVFRKNGKLQGVEANIHRLRSTM